MSTSYPGKKSTALNVITALLISFWIGAVAVGGYAVLWVVTEGLRAMGIGVTPWLWPFMVVLQGFFLALPIMIGARNWGDLRYRSLFRSWEWGVLALLLLAPIRLIPVINSTFISLVQLGLLLLLWLLVRLTAARHAPREPSGGSAIALLLVPLLLVPWLLWTALGSPLDILLNLAVGLVAGAFAAEVLVSVLLPDIVETSTPGWNLTLGGFGSAVFLAMLAVALGAGAIGVLLWLMLPAAAWAAVALARVGSPQLANRRAVALFLGLTIAIPLVMVDSEETLVILNLGARDALWWSGLAALTTAGVALVLGLLLWLVRGLLPRLKGGIGWAVAALGAWGAVVALWILLGQPGLYGDRLFVILKDQADLSALSQIEEREARLTVTYETLVSHADETQVPLRQTLDRFFVPYKPYYLVNAIEVRGGLLHRWWLESRPEVERVIASPVLRPLPEQPVEATGSADAPAGVEWNLSMIGAERVWEEFNVRGAGIVLGQSDSGVEASHPELADAYRGREEGDDYHWLDPWYQTPSPRDWGGHGTHTTGTVLGNTVGVAPDAEWIGCVNLARNLGNPALYLDCMQFLLAPYPQGGDPFRDGDPSRAAHVLNNSWGCPPEEGCDPTSLQPAVEALRAAGIFVVVSAGNEGAGACGTISAPLALYDASFTVGAVNEAGELTDFSSRGPVTADGSGRVKPDIVAPGEGVLSAFPNGSYEIADGTSMAGPHVAGVVALMWSANPTLIGDIERTEQILIDTALPFENNNSSCGDDPQNLVGHGLVDAYAAVRAALEVGE